VAVVREGVLATCCHCKQAIVSGYTPYGVIWLAVKKDPTGKLNRRECPKHRLLLIRALGDHEPEEEEAERAAYQE